MTRLRTIALLIAALFIVPVYGQGRPAYSVSAQITVTGEQTITFTHGLQRPPDQSTIQVISFTGTEPPIRPTRL